MNDREWLFSYGTLQLEAVQLATFGRRLTGRPDTLPGYRALLMQIDDPAVVATSGRTHHAIVRYTGVESDEVPGVVFEITRDELRHADEYEVAAYNRVAATQRSGLRAWVYVEGPLAQPME